MISSSRLGRRAPRLSGVAAMPLLACVLLAGKAALAQAQDCGVGTRVRGDMAGGQVGTIAEIGTQPPHVGWYRVVFAWSPNGEWYDPKTLTIRAAEGDLRCGQAAAANRPPPSRPAAAAAPSGQTTQPPPSKPGAAAMPPSRPPQPSPKQGECPMAQPPGQVTKTAAASAALFKRVIYEREAARIGAASVSAPKAIGLSFLEFEIGQPFANTLTSSRAGDKRIHDGAPEGATIYPIKTRELQCEQFDSSVKRWVTLNAGHCFRSRSGEWTCPRRTTQVVENRSIPNN